MRCMVGAVHAIALGALLAPVQAQQLSVATLDSLTERHARPALELFREYLRLPNDAHHPEDIRRLVDWLRAAFEQRGFTVTELPTPGSPQILAERPRRGARRTVLVYLQADGQPVDPTRWEQESPYEPVLKERHPDGSWRAIPWSRLDGPRDPDWRIFARSASDSKGPNVQFLAALDAMRAAGVEPGVNLKVIVDTEEEMGSPHLGDVVRRHRDRLAADMMVIFDGPPHISGRPTLTFGARGIATFTLTTYGPRAPVHSGHYGNYAPNPAERLAALLASMQDEHGRVTIPGFYDGIVIDDTTRRVLRSVPDDEAAIQRALGIAGVDSVAPTLQEALQYPSLNVRGLQSAWVGAQSRTIIPATATAEVDVRLVLETDAERLLGLVRDHIERQGYYVIARPPTDVERLAHGRIASFTYAVAYPAYRTPFDSEPGRWLSGALRRLYGAEPIKIRTSGGSIPISLFVNTLGVPAVSVPTVNPDNNQHSPNENIRVGNFVEGVRVMLAVLTQPAG